MHIRKQILTRRHLLSAQKKNQLSQRMIQRFLKELKQPSLSPLSSSFLLKNKCVALYQALPDECDLNPLISFLMAQKIRLFFPRILPHSPSSHLHQMEFVEIKPQPIMDAHTWKTGLYGILEPSDHYPKTSETTLNHILDFICVPGVIFSVTGDRIGRGQGYYDRFLLNIPNVLRISFCFDFQVFSKIPTQPWDQPVNWIITEKRILKI